MLKFDADTHEYEDGGVVLPSVTQILERVGIVNTAFFAQYPEATQRGTDVHEATALIDAGSLTAADFTEWIRGYVDSWELFKIDEGITSFDLIEQRFGSAELGYAGTADRVAIIGGRETILDIKTGRPAKYHALQTAAYAIGLFDIPEDVRRCCVHVTADAKYRVKWYDDPADLDDWRALVGYIRVMGKYGK